MISTKIKALLILAFIAPFPFSPILNYTAHLSAIELSNSLHKFAFNRTPCFELQNSDYVWFWEEIEGAPGNLPGNDVEHWGSSLGPYHNRTELLSKLQALEANFPELVDIREIGMGCMGNIIPLVVITDETVKDSKKEFFLVAHHHAREMITLENALYYIDRTIYDFVKNNEEVREILAEWKIYVIPSLNIDSLEMIHLWPEQRKNLRPTDEDGDGIYDDNEIITGRDSFDPDTTIGEDKPGGVDLNRNYAFRWNYPGGSSTNPSSQVYRGVEPFSELETRALAEFVRRHRFESAISLHSGVEMILIPWAYTRNTLCPDYEIYNELGLTLETLTGLNYDYLYPCSGEWGDWMYGARGIIAITFETYSGSSYEGIWDYFNPPANEVLDNCENIVYPGLKYMTTYDSPELAIIPTENVTNDYSKETTSPTTKNSGAKCYTIFGFGVLALIVFVLRCQRKRLLSANRKQS